VLDRDWAISCGIKGFAGYPFMVNGDSIGVLAVFSQAKMLPEFLEILQSLCTAATIGLVAALCDRDIPSESTVKFHANNILAKLKAKTRF
jgi:hypothetical protein